MFGRHGSALKATPGQEDHARELSPKGEAQVASIAQQLAGEKFDVVVASRAERARRTAHIATCCCCDLEDIGTIEAFVISEDSKEPLNVMFAQLVYAPISEYHKHELAEYLHDMGSAAVGQIVEHTAAVKTSTSMRVFVGGHAVFHPQTVYALASILENDVCEATRLKNFARNLNLGEAEVIVIELKFVNMMHVVSWRIIKPGAPAPTLAT